MSTFDLPMIEGSQPTRQKATIRDNGAIPNNYDKKTYDSAEGNHSENYYLVYMVIVMNLSRIKISIIDINFLEKNYDYAFNKFEFS
jgi:hypothetical protein